MKNTQHLDIDLGALPTVRSMKLSYACPDHVAAASRLVRLTTPLLTYQAVPERPSPELRELTITDLPDWIARTSSPLKYLEWLTPGTLTSLDIVTKDVAVSTILPFLEAHLARWPSFRTLRLVEPKGRRRQPWRAASVDEVRALGEKHGFEVCEREDKAASSGYVGYGDYGDDGGYGGYGEELYFPHGEMPDGVDFW
ncbi:hypothetical protein JCM9279_000955 [Rhodotorula babjevae]